MTHSRASDAGPGLAHGRHSATCPHCTVTQGCEYGVLDTQPCHADDCIVKLCPNCPQFDCDGCGLAHCEEHRVRVWDLALCPCCVAVALEEAELEYIELISREVCK